MCGIEVSRCDTMLSSMLDKLLLLVNAQFLDFLWFISYHFEHFVVQTQKFKTHFLAFSHFMFYVCMFFLNNFLLVVAFYCIVCTLYYSIVLRSLAFSKLSYGQLLLTVSYIKSSNYNLY